jgi:glycosyltransferase involved in cell wall biosynthesis
VPLHILAVHNRYQISGGEDQSHAAEIHMLRNNGIIVDEYIEDNQKISYLNRFDLAIRTIWSTETYVKIQQILAVTKYDLIVIQNFFPLISPSIYYAAKKYNVPCIQYLRNYRLFCLNGILFRDNRICEDCLKKPIPWPGILHRCYRNQYDASGVVAAMLVFHRIMGTWQTKVNRYIALTEFARSKFIEGGIHPELIAVKPNFIYPDPVPGDGAGDYALFVGRLSFEKGVNILLNAWNLLDIPIKLKIIGEEDPNRIILKNASKNEQIQFIGKKTSREVLDEIGNAKCVILPSLIFEGFPRVIIESFSKGTPVIVSDLTSLSELVTNGFNGLLFKTGNSTDLADKVMWMCQNPEKLKEMRLNARKEYEEKYTSELNLKFFMDIYDGIKK